MSKQTAQFSVTKPEKIDQVITFRVSKAAREALDAEAKARGVLVADIVREGLDLYFSQRSKR